MANIVMIPSPSSIHDLTTSPVSSVHPLHGVGTPSYGTGSIATPFPTVGRSSETSRHKTIGDLVQNGYWVKATGSRVTKSGWTASSDWNYVVYDPDNTLLTKLSTDTSWVKDGSGNGDPGIDFNSFSSGMTNLILVNSDQIWKKYVIATNLIKVLDCKTKGERVAIFDSVFEKSVDVKAMEF